MNRQAEWEATRARWATATTTQPAPTVAAGISAQELAQIRAKAQRFSGEPGTPLGVAMLCEIIIRLCDHLGAATASQAALVAAAVDVLENAAVYYADHATQPNAHEWCWVSTRAIEALRAAVSGQEGDVT